MDMLGVTDKSYLDYVLDYFLVLTAICAVFTSCVCTLYSVYMGGMKHIFRFVSLNLVLSITVTNIAAIPRLLLTSDPVKCEVSAIVDHYFWISQNCWLCSLAFENLKNMPLLTPSIEFRRRALLHSVLCYLSPTILLCITAVAHFSQAHWLGYLYGGRYCSLSNLGLFIFASIMPTALTLILAICFLLAAIYKFQPAKQADAQLRDAAFSLEIEKTRKWLITSLTFIFVSGICWCIHLFYNTLSITLSFYFSTFLEQLRTVLISLLLMYNVRSERSLDRKIFWEKVRVTTSSRLSIHSFHSTPVNKCNVRDTMLPRAPFYSSNCKSMYELAPNRLTYPAVVSHQSNSIAGSKLGLRYANPAQDTSSLFLSENRHFLEYPTLAGSRSANSARNLSHQVLSPRNLTLKHRSETVSAFSDFSRTATVKSPIATCTDSSPKSVSDTLRKVAAVELPPLEP